MKQVDLANSGRPDRAATAALALSMLLASLGTSIANIALPTLATAFAAPFTQIQGVIIAYLIALTVSVVVAGRLGDVFGLRRMLLVGLSLFAGGSLLCGIAPTLWTLIGARVLQGVGAAFLMTLAMGLMRATASKERIGRAMGLLGTVSALGTALGPSLGGLLIGAGSWRAIFLIQVPLAALAFVVALRLRQNPSKADGKTARAGSVLNWTLAANLVSNALVAAVMMTTLVVSPFYLGTGLGLTATTVGLVMTIGPAISIVAGIPSGRAVDAIGADRVLLGGLSMLAAGSLMLAVLPNAIGLIGFVAAIVVLTPGYQLFQAANNTVTLADVPERQRGVVSGLLSLSRNIGLIAGASAMGAVFAFGVGTTDLTHATSAAMANGMRVAFMVATVLATAAFMTALRRWSKAKLADRPC